jgi:glycosyltransferase involved in cell wall biosynthesis
VTQDLHAAVLIDGLGWGGAEMLLSHLAAGAAGAGLRLSVGYLYEKDGSAAAHHLRALGVQPVRVPVDGLLSPSSVRAVRAHLARLSPDVLHTHLGYADLLGGVAARTLQLPAVSTIHLGRWEIPAGREALRTRLIVGARRRCAQRVIAVSDAARRAYLEQGWDSPERVVTLHNGIIDAARPGAGAAVRRSLGLEPTDLVVAMVSVLRPGKGHEQALQALRLLQDERHVHLLIVGDGPLRAELAERARQFGPAVRLLGHRDDVMSVLDASDVVLHPSEHDAFPTTLLEAMAASLPVVASDVGGIPEIVVPGSTGTLVPAPVSPADLAAALAPLLDDAALRSRWGAAGRARFQERFTADRWACRVRDLYEEVTSAR